MEISKLLNQNLASDSVKNVDTYEVDISKTEKNKIKEEITNALNKVDDEEDIEILTEKNFRPERSESVKKESATTSTEKTSSKTKINENGVEELNASQYEDKVLNSKGVVYVTFGRSKGCHLCKIFERRVSNNYDEINQYASVYAMNCDKNLDLLYDLQDTVGSNKTILPIVIKFVDGKPVSEFKTSCSNSEKFKNAMIEDAQKTETTEKASTSEVAIATSNNTRNEEIVELNNEKETLEAEKTKYLNEQLLTQQDIAQKQILLHKNQVLCDFYQNEYDRIQEEIEEIQEQISKEEAKQEKEITDSTNMEDLNNKIDSLSNEATAILSKISMQSKVISSLKTSITQSKNNLSNINVSLDSVEQKLAETSSKIDAAKDCPECSISENSSQEISSKTDSTTETNKFGINMINSSNFEENTQNKDGTSYVILTLNGCHRCDILMNNLTKNNDIDAINDKVSVYLVSDKYNKGEIKYMDNLAESIGSSAYGAYPKVLKLVDGKPTELYSYKSWKEGDGQISSNLKSIRTMMEEDINS